MLTCSPANGTLCPSAETAIYLATAPITATLAAKAIRAHWRVETTSHYSRDETLGEDRSRVRSNPGVFARIRGFALLPLRADAAEPPATAWMPTRILPCANN